MSWLGDLLRSRRAKKVGRVAARMLEDNAGFRAMLEENRDRAFDHAVGFAADAAGITLDPAAVRLAVAAAELEIIHQRLLKARDRHERKMRELEGRP